MSLLTSEKGKSCDICGATTERIIGTEETYWHCWDCNKDYPLRRILNPNPISRIFKPFIYVEKF